VTGIKYLVWVHSAIVLVSLAVLVASCLWSPSKTLYWYKVGGWMAWIAYAAPFGRYYYLLFLVPAFYVLGLRAFAYPPLRVPIS
jgi:hypothetical protein